jgi:radical SAM protein with 4Fe4S-binding SPASM domain
VVGPAATGPANSGSVGHHADSDLDVHCYWKASLVVRSEKAASNRNAKIETMLLAGRFVPLPRHLTIETTSRCNLKCVMCPKTHHAVNTLENQVMSDRVFERLLPLFPHIESLDLNGVWGEAFLHPKRYVRMLRAIKRHHTDVYTMSNGTLLTDPLARDLVAFGLDKLVVSIDAATSQTYARIRPPGRFSKILDGLRALQSWKKKLDRPNPRVDLAFVGMRTNIDEFPDVVRLAADIGAAQVILQAMGEYPGLENESVAARDKTLGRKRFREAAAVGQRLGIEVVLLPSDQFEEDRRERNALEAPAVGKRYRKQCHDLWNRALIAANGDVLPCCASPVPMGNLNDSSFADIWRGDRFTNLRRQFLAGSVPRMCRTCTGMGWVEDGRSRQIRFTVGELILPRVRHRVRQYRAARWLKVRLNRLMHG